MSREQLKESMKSYIQDIYLSHRDKDLKSWKELIDLLLSYIDETILLHEKEENKLLIESLYKYIELEVKERCKNYTD